MHQPDAPCPSRTNISAAPSTQDPPLAASSELRMSPDLPALLHALAAELEAARQDLGRLAQLLHRDRNAPGTLAVVHDTATPDARRSPAPTTARGIGLRIVR